MVKKIFILILLFWIAAAQIHNPSCAYADESVETYAVSLINLIRQNPLTYAETLGHNRNTLLEQLPWLWMSGATEGLAALTASQTLAWIADSSNISDTTGIDASWPTVTINTQYAAQADISGLVAFYTYMKPSAAVEVVINNQLEKELSQDYTGKRILLSQEYKLIGSSIRPGTVQQASTTANTYYIYISFASSMLKSEA